MEFQTSDTMARKPWLVQGAIDLRQGDSLVSSKETRSRVQFDSVIVQYQQGVSFC
jgi:hypothetical protein